VLLSAAVEQRNRVSIGNTNESAFDDISASVDARKSEQEE
jgi:hypothetical protein